MTTLRQVLLDHENRTPAAVSWASLVAALAGGMTLIGAVIVVSTVFASYDTSLAGLIGSLLSVTQVSAGILLVAGAIRLMVGAGRRELIVGVALNLVVCGFYGYFALVVVPMNTTENPTTSTMLLGVALLFGAITAGALRLALHRSVTGYLELIRQEARSRG